MILNIFKQSWYLRKLRKYDEAIAAIDEAMTLAKERNDELILSRVLDEQANIYFEMGKNDEAEELFRVLLQRFYFQKINFFEIRLSHYL